MKWLLLIVSAGLLSVVYPLNKDVKRLRSEREDLLKRIIHLEADSAISHDIISRYETAFHTLEKKYPTLGDKFDQWANGIE